MTRRPDSTGPAEVCIAYFRAADARNWEMAADQLADEAAIDFTDLYGGSAATRTRDEMAVSLAAGMGRFEATQHLLGSAVLEMEVNQACCSFQAQATHRRLSDGGSDLWVIGGVYDLTLSSEQGVWRIASVRFTLLWEIGQR